MPGTVLCTRHAQTFKTFKELIYKVGQVIQRIKEGNGGTEKVRNFPESEGHRCPTGLDYLWQQCEEGTRVGRLEVGGLLIINCRCPTGKSKFGQCH